jgi:transposase
MMMGPAQQRDGKLFYTSFNLDDRIRADNPLRQIRQHLDLSWVRPAVADRYGSTGQPSIDPIVLLKLMLILFWENIPSERELMRRLPERLDWLWFCQYDLDSELPSHSVLSKARRRWGPEVFTTLFLRILQQCIDAGLVDGSVIHMDSSLIQGDVSVDSLQPAWVVQAQQLYRQLDEAESESSDEGDSGKTPPKKLSSTDPEARARVKGSQKVVGYQEHRCVDDKHGIITATKMTDASVNEGQTLPEMLQRHEANTEMTPAAVVADKAYGLAENYKMLRERGILPCIPHPEHRRKIQGKFCRDDFHYDASKDCYFCPVGQRLTRQTDKPDATRREHVYMTGRGVCQACPLRVQCYTGNYCKRIHRHMDQDTIDWADGCLPSHRRRILLRHRTTTMEGSFGDATKHGFKRARWRGLRRVRIQNLLIAAIQNLRKWLKYGHRSPTQSALSASLVSQNALPAAFWHLMSVVKSWHEVNFSFITRLNRKKPHTCPA